MPKGIGRPFNADLRKLSKSYTYGGSGLAGNLSDVMANRREASSQARPGTQSRLPPSDFDPAEAANALMARGGGTPLRTRMESVTVTGQGRKVPAQKPTVAGGKTPAKLPKSRFDMKSNLWK